jgi:photosystem II stability/assembly factor-like uncharacterized protein
MNKSALALSLSCFLFFANHANGQWVQTNLPEVGNYVNALATKGNNVFAATDIGGVFLSLNNGASWIPVDSGLPSSTDVSALAVCGNNIFAGIVSSGIFLSTDTGASWSRVSTGITNDQLSALMVNGNYIFAGTSESMQGIGRDGFILVPAQVFLSTNNGLSWTAIDSGLPGRNVRALAVCDSNIFAGTDGGVFRSTNNGALWTAADSGLTGSIPLAFAVSRKNIFAGFWGSGVFLSTNNGASWTAVNNGLPDSFTVRSFGVSGSNIFIGGDNGEVFISANNGATWTAANNGLPNNSVMAFTVSGINIFAGTWGGGVWRRPISEMVSVLPQNQKSIPLQTSLRIRTSGYLHSGVTLNYSIQSRCFVHLGIYTISGRRVAVIEQGERTPGEYTVRFNKGAIPSGLYVFRFQAGGYIESNQLMLTK